MTVANPRAGILAAVALTTDWQRDFGLPANIIRGGVCISGMYDLMPVQLSTRNNYVAFDERRSQR